MWYVFWDKEHILNCSYNKPEHSWHAYILSYLFRYRKDMLRYLYNHAQLEKIICNLKIGARVIYHTKIITFNKHISDFFKSNFKNLLTYCCQLVLYLEEFLFLVYYKYNTKVFCLHGIFLKYKTNCIGGVMVCNACSLQLWKIIDLLLTRSNQRL